MKTGMIIAMVIFIIGIVEILRLLIQSVLRHIKFIRNQPQFWENKNTDWKEQS